MFTKYDVITIGGSTEDMSLYTDEGVLIKNPGDVLRQELLAFEYGAKLTIKRAVAAYGGGAANAAVALARLGLKTACLTAVGDDDRGQGIVRNLKKERVDTRLVKTIAGEMSGFSPIIVGQGREHVSFPIRGANSRLEIAPAQAASLKRCRWIYQTSLSGNWKAVLDKVFASSSAKIAWNPGQLQLKAGRSALAKYLKRTELLVLNLDEARELVKSDRRYRSRPAVFFDKVEALLEAIAGWGPKIVVITRGAAGAAAFAAGRHHRVRAVKLKGGGANTVGVGDAFGSSLVAGLLIYKGDLDQALALAARNSAQVTTREGAQLGLLKKAEL